MAPRWLITGGLAGLLLAACTRTPAPDTVITPPPAAFSRAATLTATCSGCHGEARAETLSALTGRSAEDLLSALSAYAHDDGNTVMHRLARGYSDADIRIISEALGTKAELE